MSRIYTDGACKDGIGAWGFIVLGPKQIKVKSGTKENAGNCNNEMELYAVLKALEYIVQNGIRKCIIYTDSAYVLTGIQKLDEWKKQNWKNSRGKSIKNRILWNDVSNMLQSMNSANRFCVAIEKTKAHSGNAFNDKVDDIVRKQIKKRLGGNKNAKVYSISNN